MDPLIIKSQHFKNDYTSNYWKNDVVGFKALGLNSLPNNWTPPFIVITTFSFNLWKDETTDKNKFLLDAGLKSYINDLCKGSSQTLIVRSSSKLEKMLERGQYNSICCYSDIGPILDAINNVWSHGNIFKEKVEDEIAIIIQLHIRKIASGHLSNERRISKNSNEWFCEFDEYRKNGGRKFFGFKVNEYLSKEFINKEQLYCRNKKELLKKFRMVASISSDFSDRVHYEWVWDNERLWIVQKDFEERSKGVSPIESKGRLLKRPRKKERHVLEVLSEEYDSKLYWNKIKCVNTFKICGLPFGKIFILDDINILSNLSKGSVDKALENDLNWVLNFPMVIRTDIKNSEKLSKLLLPRTNTIFNIQDAIDFLIKTSKYFIENNIQLEDFCFLIHRFIYSKSSAISVAYPNIPKIKIDSIWGLPDGLLYYSHDSFEVSVDKTKKIKRYIRCKKEFLDVDKKGKWTKKFCSEEFDWKPSLKKKDLERIADYSFKILKHLGKPVQVMFFVNVEKATGHPECLPWFFTTEIPEKYSIEKNIKSVERSLIIRDELDLINLREKLKNEVSLRKGYILLKPEIELLRSKKFIDEVSKIALENNFVIELEGSILSHIYYILINKGIKVRCVDVFNPRTKKQIFGKLVRDLIPVIIRSHGEEVSTYKLTESELLPLIKAKVIEEALELYWENDPLKIAEEIADIYECIKNILDLLDWTFNKVELLAKEKRGKRGGFKKRIMLIETKEVPLIKKQDSILQESLIKSDEIVNGVIKRYKDDYTSTIRRPIIKGKKIHIPLIPPDVIEKGRKTILKFKETKIEIKILYKEKEVIVEVNPISRDLISDNQLTLFNL